MWTFLLVLAQAWADPACEKRLSDTGMVFLRDDLNIVCQAKPSAPTQDCMVDLLTKGKGRLRNSDFFEVYALCKTDPSPKVRECVLSGLAKKFDDPGYKSVKTVGGKCLLARPKSEALKAKKGK
jgi:hypothetical protein